MNRIKKLYNIELPIIAGGMVWCSGWKLASAVSNAGGLGLIGAGSMYPDVLREHIRKTKLATQKPFGINVPLLYPQQQDLMDIIVEEDVKIVFTSAGSPNKWTKFLHEHGILVTHVVSSSYFAKKSEDAGVDAIVAEGFEAGGHEGREETTTMNLIPSVHKVTTIPLIAAGGIGTGQQMLAAFALGAEGVQIGSRFAASIESSAHPSFKQRIIELKEGDTRLMLKQLAPVRLIKNEFYKQVEQAELAGASIEELKGLLGRGRAKLGMFEGDLVNGELEIGQVSALIDNVLSVEDIMKNIMIEYRNSYSRLMSNSNF